jgi:hypothetical protein
MGGPEAAARPWAASSMPLAAPATTGCAPKAFAVNGSE